MMTWILVGVIVLLLGVIGRMVANSRLIIGDIYHLISHMRVMANVLDRQSIVFMEMSNNFNKVLQNANPEELSVVAWLRENHKILQMMRQSHLTIINNVGDGTYKKFEKNWHKSVSSR